MQSDYKGAQSFPNICKNTSSGSKEVQKGNKVAEMNWIQMENDYKVQPNNHKYE